MRRSDRNAGSIKALIIVALLIANIALVLLRQSAPSSAANSVAEKPHFAVRMHEAVPVDDPSHH